MNIPVPGSLWAKKKKKKKIVCFCFFFFCFLFFFLFFFLIPKKKKKEKKKKLVFGGRDYKNKKQLRVFPGANKGHRPHILRLTA